MPDAIDQVTTVEEGLALVNRVAQRIPELVSGKQERDLCGERMRFRVADTGEDLLVAVGECSRMWSSSRRDEPTVPERIVVRAPHSKRSIRGWWGDSVRTLMRGKLRLFNEATLEKAMRELTAELQQAAASRRAEKENDQSRARAREAMLADVTALGVDMGPGYRGQVQADGVKAPVRIYVRDDGSVDIEVLADLADTKQLLALLGVTP